MSIQSDLKDLLRERKVSQKDFADLVGVNQAALSRFLHSSGFSIAERIAPYVYGEKKHLVCQNKEQQS